MVIALAIAGVSIGAVLAVAALKPDRLTSEGTTHIEAPPQEVFALVNDFHNWPQWAPQDRTDRKMQRSYSGAPAGVGAGSQWMSTGSAGEGHMRIIAAAPPKQLTVQVDFKKPFKAHNINEFSFAPEGSGTHVSWAMQGTNVFLARIMSVFVNMDRIMGAHFEAGLRDLKAAAESGRGAPAPTDRQ